MKFTLSIFFMLSFLFIYVQSYPQSGSYTDSRDGQVYRTVEIGGQTWMAENLRFETDESLALRVKKTKYQTLLDGSFKGARECGTKDEYGISAIHCEHLEKIGRYYPWKDANGACPDGWHLASSEEWEQLFDYVESTYGPFTNKTPLSTSKDYFVGVAKVLKSIYWPDETGLEDQLGFSILPDGRAKYDKISSLGQVAEFWTSTPLFYKSGKQSKGYYKYLTINQFGDNVFREDGIESYGRSVRCVKN